MCSYAISRYLYISGTTRQRPCQTSLGVCNRRDHFSRGLIFLDKCSLSRRLAYSDASYGGSNVDDWPPAPIAASTICHPACCDRLRCSAARRRRYMASQSIALMRSFRVVVQEPRCGAWRGSLFVCMHDMCLLSCGVNGAGAVWSEV